MTSLPLNGFSVIDLHCPSGRRADRRCASSPIGAPDVIKIEMPASTPTPTGSRRTAPISRTCTVTSAHSASTLDPEGKKIFFQLAERPMSSSRTFARRSSIASASIRGGEAGQPAHRLWQHFGLRPGRPL